MSTTAPVLPGLARPDINRPIAPDVVRSEWTKFRTVRSTYWTLFVAAVAMVGLSAILTAVYVGRYSTLSLADKLTFNPTSFSLNGILLAQLAIAVLGVLFITAEYGTGMIRATFASVPQRRSVLAAKAVVLAGATAVAGIVSSFAAFFVGQSILSSKHIQAHIGDPGVLRSVLGAGVYLAVLALLALGLGALIRHTAGAIATIFGLIFVLPGLVFALPSSWSNAISKFLPSNAGAAMFRTVRGGGPTLSPWVGFALFCGYAAAALIAAGIVVSRRDA
jgi:ABC-2 type transport system permease protein